MKFRSSSLLMSLEQLFSVQRLITKLKASDPAKDKTHWYYSVIYNTVRPCRQRAEEM